MFSVTTASAKKDKSTADTRATMPMQADLVRSSINRANLELSSIQNYVDLKYSGKTYCYGSMEGKEKNSNNQIFS